MLFNGHNSSVRERLWFFSFFQIRRLRLKEVNLLKDILVSGLARSESRWAHSRTSGVGHYIIYYLRGSSASVVEMGKSEQGGFGRDQHGIW